MYRKIAVAAVGAACLIALAGCGSTATPAASAKSEAPAASAPTENKAPAAAPAKAPAPQAHKPGEAIDLTGVKFTVNGVRFSATQGDKKAKDGTTYMIVDLTVENGRKDAFQSRGMVQFQVSTAEGFAFDRTTLPGLKGNLDAEIAPGSKLNGELAFTVPKDSKQLKISYTPDVLKPDQVGVVALGDAQ
jgi:hypothetical protein